jgi:hypothetical protein
MPTNAPYVFTASMDVRPDKEALFHEVYDREHVPSLLQVPGVISVVRLKLEPLRVSIGGEIKTIVFENEPKFGAVYEIESPDVLTSAAWAKAVEQGRWPAEVRPYTTNRRHVLHSRIA